MSFYIAIHVVQSVVGYCYVNVVCLSICLSVTLKYCSQCGLAMFESVIIDLINILTRIINLESSQFVASQLEIYSLKISRTPQISRGIGVGCCFQQKTLQYHIL